MHGGDIIAEILKAQGVPFLFTLCGGHISPILVGCKQRGIRVIDVRHEASAVFAADAVARLTGIPGVAAVTAGPGLTNTITAVKNAQLAQSPVVLLGGATATALKGRGALQDIDQMALLEPHVKWAKSLRRVKELAPALEQAFRVCRSGVPGPVFLECPVDLLYDESLVRQWYGGKSQSRGSLSDRLLKLYLQRHVNNLFAGAEGVKPGIPRSVSPPLPSPAKIRRAAEKLGRAERPLLLLGSQAVLEAPEAAGIASAVERLGAPVYLSGMARGLLGQNHPLQMRHQRRQALKEADLVILAGVPCDFRLDYGRHIRRGAYLVSANRSRTEMRKNRRPDLGVMGDVGLFLRQLSEQNIENRAWAGWIEQLRRRDEERDAEIQRKSEEPGDSGLNPLLICREIESRITEQSVLAADGGDFVATASYIISPRGPLSWLDPGVFGALGAGAGFALGAKLCRPEAEVWILYGDGSAGYSLAEFDTFVRHQVPIIAVVGNDAGWTQIAREQVEVFSDEVGTALRRSDYHRVAEGFGGKGFLLKEPGKIAETLHLAQKAAAGGTPALVNVHLGKTDFRKGSISM